MKTLHVDGKAAESKALSKDLVWSLVYQRDIGNQQISGWTGFNILTTDKVAVAQDTISYLPTINAPATNMLTVYEVLRQTQMIKDALDLQHVVSVFDQALYAKAAEIKWKHPDKFSSIVLRMGAFHTSAISLG